MEKQTLIRRIKSPILRQLVNTAILMILVFVIGRLEIEWVGPGNPRVYFIVLIAVTFIAFIIVIYFMKEKTLKRLDFYPYDFEEQDEREIHLTAKAARRSFFMMEYILGGGALFVMLAGAYDANTTLRWVGVTLACLYVIMHLVYLLSYKKEIK